MSKAAELAALIGGTSGSSLSNRNMIINGAMQVAQRGTSVTGVTSDGYLVVDRQEIDINGAGTWTMSQDTNAPDGFGSSFKFACTTANASLGSTGRLAVRQKIEGQNLQQLKKGTSNAEAVTLSFWVKSSKTGTYVAEIYDYDNSRHINKAYTINSADTWEYKAITFSGDTTGSFANDNGLSAHLHFWLAAGSSYSSGTLQTSWGAAATANRAVGNVNLADSTSNTWQITGIQLELGEQATPFEHRSIGDELARCQRYYQRIESSSGLSVSALYAQFNVPFPVEMRATPSASISDANGVACARITDHYTSDATVTSGATISLSNASKNGARVQIGSFSGLTTGRFVAFLPGGSYSSFMRFDAEL